MDKESVFKSLARIETIKLLRKESFGNRLLKGWRGEFEFYKVCKQQKIAFIEGPWILRPTEEPRRYVLFFHTGKIDSFPKEILDFNSSYIIPFVFCSRIQCETVQYPPEWYETSSGIWRSSTPRPQVLNVKYDVYDRNLTYITTVNYENASLLFTNEPFNFRLTRRSRFFGFDQEHINNILPEKDSFDEDFLNILYAKRFFLSYVLSGFSFIEIGDLDAMLLLNGKRFIVEIKEKFPIPQTNEFGWDAHRMVPFFFWQKEMKAKVVYCVREVVSETDRSFKDWKLIDLDRFLLYSNYSAAIAGSAGAFGGGRTTTLQVPVERFFSLSRESLRDILSKM